MPALPNWTLSQTSRERLSHLLESARDLGLDPDAVAAGGLAAIQALMALKRAQDAGEGERRETLIAQALAALRGLDPNVHGDLLRQAQARALALQGRNGDNDCEWCCVPPDRLRVIRIDARYRVVPSPTSMERD